MPAGNGTRRELSPDERRRLTDAAVDLVLAHGYDAVTRERLLERAGISDAAFESAYKGVEDCVLRLVGEGVEEFREEVFAGYEAHEAWRDGLRAAAYAAARWVRDHPRQIVFSTMTMNGATELARARRDLALRTFAEIVDAGRAELDCPPLVSPDTAMAVVGAIYELLQRELWKGRGTARAEDFVPELMYLAVRPYLGHAEAVKELSIPAPELAA